MLPTGQSKKHNAEQSVHESREKENREKVHKQEEGRVKKLQLNFYLCDKTTHTG